MAVVRPYKSGPLAGIEYSSERTKRNAREYYKKHSIALTNDQARVLARGGLSAAQKTRDRNRELMAQRWAQQRVARDGGNIFIEQNRMLVSTSEFSRVWRAAAAGGFEPGSPAFQRLLYGAGMRTGFDKGETAIIHYGQYVKMEWDNLEKLGARSAEDVLASFERTGS